MDYNTLFYVWMFSAFNFTTRFLESGKKKYLVYFIKIKEFHVLQCPYIWLYVIFSAVLLK